jgi:colanic acid biosynthesis glycosyl transferase WcaI
LIERLRHLAHAIDFTPDSTAAGSRAGVLVDWLARRGHCLSIVAGTADEGRRRRWGEPRRGLRVFRCEGEVGEARPHEPPSFDVASVSTLLSEAASFRPDLIAAFSPTASAASAVIGAAQAAGVPAWLHLEEAGRPLGVESSFTCVSLASLDAEAKLAERGVGGNEALALAPWVDTRAIAPREAPGPLRGAFVRAEDDIVVLYVGSCADGRVAQILIDAARNVPARGAILFVAAVKGSAAGLLAAAASELPQLRLLRLPQPHELGDLLDAADIHLLPMGTDVDEPLLPSRLASLLASGRPIVAAMPAAGLPLALAGAVTITAPTGGAVAAAVVGLAARPDERKARGLAARRAAEDYFSKERVLRRLERRLMALAGRAAA